MKEAEEKRLNELAACVQAAKVAKTNAVPFSRVVAHYRNYMIAHNRYDLEDKKRTFFNFRHTGASRIAQRGKTPAHLLAVVQMMGDTSVATVNRHYFKMQPE